MKPRLLLLGIAFILFYLFTDLNWQIGRYLGGNRMYSFLQTRHGIFSETSSLLSFLLDSMLGYLILLEFFARRQMRTLAILIYFLIGVPLMIGTRYLVQEVIFYHISGYHNYSNAMRVPTRYFMDNIYFSIYYSAFGIVFFFIQFSAYNQQRQRELLLQNRSAELSFLRSQINPHFLFNSLNNIYTLVYQQSAKALPSISQLSELMRYMLYEKADLVPLDKEVQYLKHLIDLQLMRYDFEPACQITLNSNANTMIAPLTLVPFVENAFKHGDLQDEQHPLLIELSTEDHLLRFKVENKISHLLRDDTGGIGLGNVKKRLALIYGDKHSLEINQTDQIFSVLLTVQLHD
jgi:two-component system, LytTR family, sensor kinase